MAQTSSTAKRISVIPGDGIGKEVVQEAVKVLKAAASTGKRKLTLTNFDWGAERYLLDGTTLPQNAPEMLRQDFDAILLGAMGDPRVPSNQHAADILLGLRSKLDLYVNLRPCMLFESRLCPLKDRTHRDVRFIVVRENTEGLYAGMGGIFKKGTPDELALQEDVNTRKGVERILRYAFELARSKGMTRVCMSDKSNALQYGHDLWMRVFQEVKAEYEDMQASHLYIDNLVLQMVKDPSQFQIIVACNLFGDIASDLGAQLAGGLGLSPSGNIHPGRVSMFEPVHGSAPSLVGKGVANPMGAVLSAAMMCEYIGWKYEAEMIEASVRTAIHESKVTPDIGGTLHTEEVGDWLAEFVASGAASAAT